MASEPSQKGNDAAQAAAEDLERVRRNVIRTIVDEVKRELDSSEAARIHAKVDTHKKFDRYLKGFENAQ